MAGTHLQALTSHGRVTCAALLVAACLVSSCASDGPDRPTASRDAVLQSPSANVPDGVQDVRNELAAQRSSTLSQMDVRSGSSTSSAADGGSPWYSGIFDALDFAVSVGGLLW